MQPEFLMQKVEKSQNGIRGEEAIIFIPTLEYILRSVLQNLTHHFLSISYVFFILAFVFFA